MNLEGEWTTEDYNIDDIEKYYVESGEYGQTKNQDGIHVGFDGEIRIPMVSQYGSTPPASQSDKMFGGMLEVFLNQFEECVNRINGTFSEGFHLYPESEQIKEKHTLWKDMLKKVVPTDATSGEPHTPNNKTLGKGTNADNVEMSQLSQWTPTFVEEVLQSVEKTNTSQIQIVEVVENPHSSSQRSHKRQPRNMNFQLEGSGYTRTRPGKAQIRSQRQTELTEALRSPYMKMAVELRKRLDNTEVSVSAYMFSAWASPWDTLCKTAKGVPVMRSPLESLLLGITVHIVNENQYMSTEEIRATTFTENMESVLLYGDVKNIRDMSLVFVPVLHNDHYYCVCFKLRDNKIEVLDNSAAEVSFEGKFKGRPEKLRDALATYLDNVGHPAGSKIRQVVPIRLEMMWRIMNK